jgi:hypothetical protein
MMNRRARGPASFFTAHGLPYALANCTGHINAAVNVVKDESRFRAMKGARAAISHRRLPGEEVDNAWTGQTTPCDPFLAFL